MSLAFEFATAGRIVFGAGVRRSLATIVGGLGRRVLLVTGASQRHTAWLVPALEEHGLEHVTLTVDGEPTTDLVRAGADKARQAGCEVVLGLGGGSALDTAKAVAAMATQPDDLLEYLEVIGRGRPLTAPALPCVAAPTTAGTGSEVTRNAVLNDLPHRVKVSLRSPHLLPRVALVDPELTWSLPRAVTAATGLDALTQLLEPFVGARAQPLTDGLCREGLARIGWALRTVCDEPEHAEAREAMSLASLFGGLALANAGLGAVHGFAGPLGGQFDAPHGALCACLLPEVMEANLRALRARQPRHEALRRYQEAARLLTGRPEAEAEDGAAWVRALCDTLAIPPLSAYGMSADDIPSVVEKAKQASSMKGNPIILTDSELTSILERAGGGKFQIMN